MKTNEFHGLIKNKRGQFAIEAVLLMTVLVGAFIALTKEARDRKVLQNLTAEPLTRLATMAGYGTWKEACSAQGKSNKETLGKCHPNSIHRSLSSDPSQ
ncbi:MAG: hypothetical protein H7328_09395 [Bdellovibrio sp.]|nr:hypothetical protein [Bdellovibrio sp.]